MSKQTQDKRLQHVLAQIAGLPALGTCGYTYGITTTEVIKAGEDPSKSKSLRWREVACHGDGMLFAGQMTRQKSRILL